MNCITCAHQLYCLLGAECSNEGYKHYFPKETHETIPNNNSVDSTIASGD